ncbi:NFACT family protein [Helicobacter anatolicus]|uniref:NFACT family protein n=1 Tax=Helicobacter anatolicus TaxID=2905874 RepID=UPI001E38FC26|nr:NFACT family protein [Helicobacter anatolicus]MCE3039506.1 NFACT family protein [Helicobacter anatolicus]
MKLSFLKNIAKLFKEYKQIHHIKRINDNLFKLQLQQDIFYLDLNKSQSQIFIGENILSQKNYHAPFDLMLQKLCTKASINDCYTDGNNRILIFSLTQNNAYKSYHFFLHFEFTGKYTNAILVDSKQIILEAMRHLNKDKSSREIKVNHTLIPLFQKNFHYTPEEYNKEKLLENLKNHYVQIMQKNLESKRKAILYSLEKKMQKYNLLLDSLPSEIKLLEESKKLSNDATLLLANLHLLAPYQDKITLQDFMQNYITLSFEKTFASPQDLVNHMFNQSKKTLQKAKGISIQKQNLKDKILFLHKEISFIQETKNLENLLILQPSKKNQKQAPKFESFFIENHKISLGKNQNENKQLLENAKANDIWLHIRDIPSSHMIIHCGKSKVPLHIIQKAGEILVGLDCIKKGNFAVDYTLRKFVKIKEKANVVYTKHQTLMYKK